jgi:DNA (cytosine-5)-methyltransferase 1
VSIDGKEPLSKDKIKRKGDKWIRETYNNYIATNNIGSIVNAKGSDLEIVDTKNHEYIVFYTFPCQDLSVAGKQRGMSQDSGSRSSLLWHVERLLKECDEKPQVLIMENVSQVHGKKFIDDWNRWLKALEDLGYKTFYADLNAKDYGIAQNRLRTFAVSILDKNAKYVFPEPIELTTCMKDYLEDHVDEKYYINTDKAKKLIQQLIDRGELPKPGEKEGIDLTINEPHIIDKANCIKARFDASIVNFKSDGTGVVETILMENMGGKDREPNCKTTDVANTLMARDYKGTPNQFFNGVVEHE